VEPTRDRWHADFVLSPVGKEERATLTALMPTLTDAVEVWLHEGVDVAMNRFNR
jgi:peptidyl-tRNA hydrolase